MPQDGIKSVVYRSFFSCDDPKGVAESKTSRKSKAVLQKTDDDNKVDCQWKLKNLDMSFSRDQDRKDNSSSVQLMEVSRETYKLNQVIDTWSKGLSFDSQSKDIAKDLLKGALDLQESLTMLGKLQEASKYMVMLKKKHKENANDGGRKLEGARIIERSVSDRFGYRDDKMDFQKPRLSADGSSRDCYEELRKVIRESFARQNLLPKNSVEERGRFNSGKNFSEESTCSERLRLDMSLDFPSTSSSHSSTFHSNELDSFDGSLSKSQEQKPKGPNVIAKLMGLEEIPSKPWQSTMEKEKEKDKQMDNVKPIFDIDLPKGARKPSSCSFQKVDTRRRTLEELIETAEFQGLVSNKCIADGSRHHKRGLFDDAPPIDIMKPLNFSVSFEEELQEQKHMHEVIYGNDMIRKWKMEKAVPPKKVCDCKRALNLREIQRRLRAEMSPLKRLSKDTEKKDLGNVLEKSEDRLIKAQEKRSSTRLNACSPVKPKVQKKEALEGRVDNSKSKDGSKHQNVNKPSSTSPKKPERELNLSKSRVLQQRRTPSNSTSECSTLTASRSPNVHREKTAKNKKQVSKVERQCRNDDIQIEPMCEDKHEVTTVNKITSPEQLPREVETSLSLDNGKSTDSHLSDSIELIILDKSDIESIGDVNMSYISTEKIICKTGSTTRDLLLANSLFLNQAELFHFNAYQPITPQTTSFREDGVANSKLLLDCAKELLEHKSLRCTLASHPLTHSTLERSKIIPQEQLVDEICDGIEDLQSYHELSAECLPADTLSAVLQKDLWCKGVASGSWDLGWRYWFSLDEIEQVVIEMDQTVFGGIIDDFVEELQASSL